MGVSLRPGAYDASSDKFLTKILGKVILRNKDYPGLMILLCGYELIRERYKFNLITSGVQNTFVKFQMTVDFYLSVIKATAIF